MSRSRRCAPFLLLAAVAHAQEPRNVSGGPLRDDQACYDVRHYRLELDVDVARKSIAGVLTMRASLLAPAATIGLDLDPALTVHEVKVDGRTAPFERPPGRILVRPEPALAGGAMFEVAVRYGGAPRVARNPPWDGGFTWSKTKSGEPWIATSCQGEGADLWWPCKDHPSDKPDGFDLVCTIPKGLVLASNGVRVGEPKTEGERSTFHWRSTQPIANYNVALNIAPYVEIADTYTCIDGTAMPFVMWVLPESQSRAKRCQPQFMDHLRAFEELLGPYPFRAEKYGIAETPHLGMEHQTIVAYGNGFRDEQYDWLHNHELAHEWWGNLVTCRDWKDMWLHEGFGTYMQPLYRERRFGRKAYDDEIRKYRHGNRSAIAPRESKTSAQIYFAGGSNDLYYKGAHVLHTLRWLLGEDTFFMALRRFCYPTEAAAKATDGTQVRFVDTDDFVRLCSELAGEDVAWFFDVYVRHGGLPTLTSAVENGELVLRWQTPGDLPFALPVPVQFRGEEVRVPMPGGSGRLRVDDHEWSVDPSSRILMLRPRTGR